MGVGEYGECCEGREAPLQGTLLTIFVCFLHVVCWGWPIVREVVVLCHLS